MAVLQNIWWYLVLIGVMILIHEAGHYLAARLFDVKVETFSFGFGPRIWGFQHGETDFRISAIPLGGYVKMTGEQYSGDVSDPKGTPANTPQGTPDPRALTSKPRWQRMIVAFAGPGVNILLSVGLLAGLYMVYFPKVPNPNSPFVGFVVPDSAAAKAGVHLGDQIVQVDDMVDPTWEAIQRHEAISPNHPMEVWVQRGSGKATERLHLTVTPKLDDKQGLGYAGWEQAEDLTAADITKGMGADKAGLQKGDILLSVNGEQLRSVSHLHQIEAETKGARLRLEVRRGTEVKAVSAVPIFADSGGGSGKEKKWLLGLELRSRVEIVKLSFSAALSESIRQNTANARMIGQMLQRMVQQRMPARSLSGPIGMAKMSGDAAREGPFPFIYLMAAVSLNLAIFNLLPIPILDGGVMLMLFIEMLMRRDVDMKIKETVLKVGFVFLMFVLVFALYNDISKG